MFWDFSGREETHKCVLVHSKYVAVQRRKDHIYFPSSRKLSLSRIQSVLFIEAKEIKGTKTVSALQAL